MMKAAAEAARAAQEGASCHHRMVAPAEQGAQEAVEAPSAVAASSHRTRLRRLNSRCRCSSRRAIAAAPAGGDYSGRRVVPMTDRDVSASCGNPLVAPQRGVLLHPSPDPHPSLLMGPSHEERPPS